LNAETMTVNPYQSPQAAVEQPPTQHKPAPLARAAYLSLACGAIPTVAATVFWLAFLRVLGSWDPWEFPLGVLAQITTFLAILVWCAIGLSWLIFFVVRR
jgi:hypothetical protein